MSDTAPMPASSGWKVISQHEETQPTPGGNFEKGVVVVFQTGKGTTGSVFVPEALYSEAQVRQMVAQKAAALDAVAGLSSTS